MKKIKSLVGENGYLEKVIFEDYEQVTREGGFVTPDRI